MERKIGSMINEVPISVDPSRPKEAMLAAKASGKTRVQAFFDHMASVLDFEKLGIDKDKLPKELNAAQFTVLRGIFEIATQSAEIMARFKCPKCKEIFKDVTVDTKMERNKLQALGMLADRFAPKLQTIDTNVNINLVVSNISASLITVVSKYVPSRDRERMLEDFDKAFEKIESSLSGDNLGPTVLSSIAKQAPGNGGENPQGLGGFKV